MSTIMSRDFFKTMLDEKLKAKIVVSCFLHQTGFAPDNVVTLDNGETCVTGNGYGLAWSWPCVRVVDQLTFDEFQAKIDVVLARFEKRKEPELVVTMETKPEEKSQLEIFK